MKNIKLKLILVNITDDYVLIIVANMFNNLYECIWYQFITYTKPINVNDIHKMKNKVKVSPKEAKKQKNLKARKTHGFNSCFVISVYPLDILSIEKATEYRNDW